MGESKKYGINTRAIHTQKKFKLPTFLDYDLIYSHHFFRLLQRAKNIYLIYNSASHGLFSGEKSRFLYQLDFFKEKEDIDEETYHLAYLMLLTETELRLKSDQRLKYEWQKLLGQMVKSKAMQYQKRLQ